MSRSWSAPYWVAAAAALVFFTNLGGAALFDEDEAIHATCAREMLEQDQWVVPSFNGQMFPDKPPLMFWMMMVAYKLFGTTEFAARFPSAVLGVATVLATYALGKRLFSAGAGFWAGLILASTIIFTVSARAATVDSALTFLTTAAMICFVRGQEEKETRWISFVLAYACLGVAVLAKGPVGVVLPGAVFCVFLCVVHVPRASGDTIPVNGGDRPTRWVKLAQWIARLSRPFLPRNLLRSLWQMRPLTGAAVVAAIALPWYVLVGARTHGAWLVEFFGVHNLHRAWRRCTIAADRSCSITLR